MFMPIYLLPQYDIGTRKIYEERWDTIEGELLSEKVRGMIKDGAGEDFLQSEFEQGHLGFLENMWDLKGFRISDENIRFPKNDNFEAIDFSYASFSRCIFDGACFPGTKFNFSLAQNCEFVNCIFAYAAFYGATIENIVFRHCDFIEHDRFVNCDFKNVRFENCFIPENILFDSRFDELCQVDRLRKNSVWESLVLQNKHIAGIYKGIKDTYKSGNVIKQSRQYFFEERKALTRHNAKDWKEKIGGFFLEFLTGYGVRPFRVLRNMILGLIFFSAFFIAKFGAPQGLLISAGAFFTFGANVNYLQSTDTFWMILYIAESFSGIALMALFITVLANVWFAEK